MRITEAEWKVMDALWQKSPASARDVLEMVHDETDWAYGTVKTLLNRLVKKGVVTMRRRANTNLYEAAISLPEARRLEVRGLLDRAFGGAIGPLMNFLFDEKELSTGDAELLRRRLDGLGDKGD